MTADDRGYVLVISLQPLDATTILFFGHLSDRAPNAIRIMQHGGDNVAAAIAGASAIVLVRGLFEHAAISRCARALRIPHYYFVDDNFMVLRKQLGSQAPFVDRYSEANVREALAGFSGVLLATPRLLEYFSDHNLHARLRLFPPTARERVVGAESAARTGMHVAFFGGRHLHGIFLQTVLPAIRRLAQRRPVTLIATGIPERVEESEGLTVIHEPYDESYSQGVRRLAGHRVDALVHPVAAHLANNAFKNPHALITANALGAVPVVSSLAPYDEIRSSGVALVCNDTEDLWYQALVQVTDSDAAAAIRARLAAYCATQFGAAANLGVIDEMLHGRRAPARWSVPWRVGIARAILLIDRVGRALARATRMTQSSGPAAV